MNFDAMTRDELKSFAIENMFDHDDDFIYVTFDNAANEFSFTYACRRANIDAQYASDNNDDVYAYDARANIDAHDYTLTHVRVRANVDYDDDGGTITIE